MATAETAVTGAKSGISRAHRRVIFASSLGTVFEWFDFYLYGTLAVFFGALFFPPGNETAAFLASLATFGAGFAVRPLGALVFGRIGDMVGRKYTFLITIVVMGLATALVGVLPTYAQIGIWAPILLVTLRLAQGLALGGEYGGAATYVAEHAPIEQRGYYTSWIQTTATLGFFLSLAVILSCRLGFGDEDFRAWGWRVPFLVSVLLLAVSVYIRLKLEESPVFLHMKATGQHSRAPLSEAFGEWRNLRVVLLALFGATAGQGVVWYTGQFYALFFLQNTLKLDFRLSYTLIAVALLIGTPLFVVFGRLSDRIGRKRVMVAGCVLAALTYIPIFHGLTLFANPALSEFAERAQVSVAAHHCRFNIFARPATDCDRARDFLTKAGVSYEQLPFNGTDEVLTTIAGVQLRGFDEAQYQAALANAGYPQKADPARVNKPATVLLLVILMVYVAMVYGPIAAFLVELFPTRIRYSAMSLPYHIGNGWFGGFLPFLAAALVVKSGNIYYGLWYPILIAAMTAVVGAVFIRDRREADLRG
ncbi:MAG TPA: MFS transporter [Steroidobacteraceae bacterium]|nr:MFS transporter [Steroidobacteraceae bacterium]